MDVCFVPLQSFSLSTAIWDSAGRMWCFCIHRFQKINQLLPSFVKEAEDLVRAIDSSSKGFTQTQMAENSRGSHWFSVFGYDRNNKKAWFFFLTPSKVI
jgi:hypothetical protein